MEDCHWVGEEADGKELGVYTHRSDFLWSMTVYHGISYTVIVMSLRTMKTADSI